MFQNLSPQQAIHCYEGREVRKFAGKRVAVIGAGQSALESAALLHEANAQVEVIARQSSLRWIGQHTGYTTWARFLRCSTLRTMWARSESAAWWRIRSWCLRFHWGFATRSEHELCEPQDPRWLPARLATVKITLGTQRVCRPTPLVTKSRSNSMTAANVGWIMFCLEPGIRWTYRDTIFFPKELTRDIEQFDGYPKLAGGFRTSVPGLHFIGATAARSFGPLLYFVAGTEFASRELVSHLSRDWR